MECSHCSAQAVIEDPPRCKEHFIKSFESRVVETIQEHKLIRKGRRVCVAASGGKDSTTILLILHEAGYDVRPLLIDEGIAGYREHTRRDLEQFCHKHGIPVDIISFKEEVGKTLDEMDPSHPCSMCGTLRRHFLERHARGFDVIATGHNADDEAQSVIMNLVRANTKLFFRGGPKTGSNAKGFVPRVKPLYFCTEKEVMTYAVLRGIASDFTECPNIGRALRATIRDALNAYELKHPGAKLRILTHYIGLNSVHKSLDSSRVCGSCTLPAAGSLCKACAIRKAL